MHRLMLISLIAAASPLVAQQVPQSTGRAHGIIASATADTRVTPDRAQVSVGVQTRAATAAQASADNAQKTRAVIDAIKARGIPASRITTSEYNLFPEYDHSEQPVEGAKGPRVIGYVANNTVRVELEQIDRVGPVIDAAIGAGANMVNTIQFYAANVDVQRRAALAEAVARARADAEALARAAGGSLGELRELTTDMPPARPYLMGGQAMMRASADATPIEPGQQQLMVWVSGRWAFNTAGKQ